jgi:hypothetical protein
MQYIGSGPFLSRWRILLAAIWLANAVAEAVASTPAPVSLGTTPIFSEPSCASIGQEAVCGALGQGQTLMMNRYSAGAWSGWTVLKGSEAVTQPSCFKLQFFGNGHLFYDVECAVGNENHYLVIYGSDGSSTVVSAGLDGPPSCVALTRTLVLCAGRHWGGGVFSAYAKRDITYKWTVLPVLSNDGHYFSAVVCGHDAQYPADAYCQWSDNHSGTGVQSGVVIRRFQGSSLAWQSSAFQNATVLEPLGCFNLWPSSTVPPGADPGDMYCGVIGPAASSYFAANFDQGGGPDDWSSYTSTFNLPTDGAGCTSIASAGSSTGATFVCALTGTDNAGNPGDLLVVAGNTVEDDVDHFVGRPSCFAMDSSALANGAAMCVSRRTDNTAASVTYP